MKPSEKFEPNAIFFSIYDSVKEPDSTQREAYELAESIFGQKIEAGFGFQARKFDSFESFRVVNHRRIKGEFV